jgi:hypothetical protein
MLKKTIYRLKSVSHILKIYSKKISISLLIVAYSTILLGQSPVQNLDIQGNILKHNRQNQVYIPGLAALGLQAKRYKVARIVHDFKNWGSNSLLEVELDEFSYSRGLRKKYFVSVGYLDYAECYLASSQGIGDNNSKVTLGPKTLLSGDLYYYDVFVDVRYYGTFDAKITTSRNTIFNTDPTNTGCAIYTTPAGANIPDFVVDETVTNKGKTSFDKDVSFNGDLIVKGQSIYNLNSKGQTKIGFLAAVGTQAKRYKVARVVHDFNDWGLNAIIEVELDEISYSRGLKKKYIIDIGYSDFSESYLADYQGVGDNNAKVTLGPKTLVSGDLFYYDIFVDVKYYATFDVKINTSRNTILNSEPTTSVCAIYTTPTGSNIPDFNIDEQVVNIEKTVFTKNVGIGTTNPSEKLEVNGNTNFTGQTWIGTKFPSYTPLNVNQTTPYPYSAVFAHSDPSINRMLVIGAFNNNIGIQSSIFTTGNFTPLLLNPSGGDVAIGTNTLPMGYKLAVNGNVIANKIVVKQYPWADFVFKPDYKLPPLSIVEQHIKEKGHLQDIPSEKEVAEKGIDLGSMDAKLLQKVEELTLYAIMQEKKSIKQDKMFEEQQKQIEDLKKQNALLMQLIKQK